MIHRAAEDLSFNRLRSREPENIVIKSRMNAGRKCQCTGTDVCNCSKCLRAIDAVERNSRGDAEAAGVMRRPVAVGAHQQPQWLSRWPICKPSSEYCIALVCQVHAPTRFFWIPPGFLVVGITVSRARRIDPN